MKKYHLTFGIPMYNCEKYISDLLKCFKANKYKYNYEILIIDDGSEDSSNEICHKFNYPNIKIIKKENGGVSSARNEILNKAKGEWITFVDADDLIDLDEYIKMFDKIQSEECDYAINISNSKYIKKCLKKEPKLSYLVENELINSLCTNFFKKELILKNNLSFKNDISVGEDLLFNLSYYKYANKKMFFSNKNMYHYRVINPNSLTHKFRENKYFELNKVNKNCMKIIGTDIISNYKALEYIRIKGNFSCVKDMIIFSDKISNKVEKIKKMKHDYKMKFLLLNSISKTLFYYLWYLLPPSILLFLVKVYLNKRGVFVEKL